MTRRDRVGDPPGRREAAGDVGYRQGFPTPSGGSPRRPERRLHKAFGRRRTRLAMSRIATPRAPSRKPWEAVSMGHYRRSLVLGPWIVRHQAGVLAGPVKEQWGGSEYVELGSYRTGRAAILALTASSVCVR